MAFAGLPEPSEGLTRYYAAGAVRLYGQECYAKALRDAVAVIEQRKPYDQALVKEILALGEKENG